MRAIIVDGQWVKLIFIYTCIVYFLPNLPILVGDGNITIIVILPSPTKIVCVTVCAILVETVSSYLE